MTSSVFPGALDSFVDPNPTSKCNATNTTGPIALHSALHGLENDAIAALQVKVGIDSSADHNSLDYKITAALAAILALQGTSLLYGPGPPGSGTGVDGNFYLDETAHVIYGPKASGAWPAGTSIIGPQGPQGVDGSAGAAGPTGPPGANASVYVGVTTNSGNAYTATPSPAITSYVAGTLYTAQFNAANTGATTLNISGLGALNVYKNGAALAGGEIVANASIALTYDGTRLNMTGDGSSGGGGGSSGISHGLDKDRPAPAANTIYIAHDSGITYSSDGVEWYTNIGPDKIAIASLSDTNYMVSRYGGVNVGPIMANPYTVCLGWNTNILPGTTQQLLVTYFDGVAGWYLSGSSHNANKLCILMKGVNGATVEIEFPGMPALTVGPHSVAISYDGSNLNLVLDGGSVVTVAVTGTYVAPVSTTKFYIGRYYNNGFGAANSSISYLYGYSSALSTTDMQALTATPGNFRPGAITTAVAYAWTAKAPWMQTSQRPWGSQVNANGFANLTAVGTLQFVEF